MSSESETRARWFANQLLDDEKNELQQQVGRNFEYLLDNVEYWESSDFDYTDMPELERTSKWLIQISVVFGVRWPPAKNNSLYVVSRDGGEFVGLYGHEESAGERAVEIGGSVEEQAITQQGVDSLLEGLGDDGAHGAVKENLQFLLNHHTEFMDGELMPDDLPQLEENTKWLMVYSVLFATLWELSHPSLYGVFSTENKLLDICGAETAAEKQSGGKKYVQRLTVADGEKDTEEVIGALL